MSDFFKAAFAVCVLIVGCTLFAGAVPFVVTPRPVPVSVPGPKWSFA